MNPADTGKPRMIVVAGPTATGKSGLAVRLAAGLGGEVISADSAQVYRGMDIGTAKIKPDEMKGIPHHLIDIMDIDEDYSAALFKNMAAEKAEEIFARGKIPVICGGTGFYIQALIYGIDFALEDAPDNSAADISGELYSIYAVHGAGAVLDMLKEEDSYTYETIDRANIKKVIRALTFKRMSGISLREHSEREAKKKEDPPYDCCFFVLNGDRKRLYERIDRRVDSMLEEGLLAEVSSLMEKGLKRDSTAGQAIGYKEIMSYLNGEISLKAASEKIKINTRHFAKRQLTWFRREKNAVWTDIDDGRAFDNAREYIQRVWNI